MTTFLLVALFIVLLLAGVPPGANGTTMRIVFAGNACPWAGKPVAHKHVAAQSRNNLQ